MWRALTLNILLFGYSVDGGEARVVDLVQGERIPLEIIDALTDARVRKWAFNAQFERVCLSRWLRRNGYPLRNEGYSTPGDTCMDYLNPAGWYCTMVWSAYLGLPLSLKGRGHGAWAGQAETHRGQGAHPVFLQPGPGRRAASAVRRPGQMGAIQGIQPARRRGRAGHTGAAARVSGA